MKTPSSEKFKKFVGNSNGMFVIEAETMAKGSFVNWKNKYKLRHLLSNRYLSLGDEKYSSKASSRDLKDLRKPVLVDDCSDAGLFQFQIIYSTLSTKNRDLQIKYLKKDSYFRLCYDESA